MNTLLTGSTGFVGKQVLQTLLATNHNVRVAVREHVQDNTSNYEELQVDLSIGQDLASAVQGIDTVIHCAGRAHVMNEDASDALSQYRTINTEGTVRLAEAAIAAGVKRFVFISSIKVSGEKTAAATPFLASDRAMPADPYGQSKYEAEQALLKLSQASEMEVVIIRPPLVYGPGVKGNFATMINWTKRGIPLPFGAVRNKRSLVALDNLVNFIILCADRSASPLAANEIFLISDNEDVSSSVLLRRVAAAFGKKAILIPVPVFIMALAAKLIGKSAVTDRLFGNLQVDCNKAQELLSWQPVTTMEQQLASMAEPSN